MNKQTILIIGCGSIGLRHLRNFQNTGRVKLVACDSNPAILDAIRKKHAQVPTSTNWREALSDKCTAVVICTPAHMHISMAQEALRQGKHVLIEKPLSHSRVGVTELLRLHENSDLEVAVAYIYHVYPFLSEVRSFIAKESFGPVRQVVVTTGSPFHFLRPTYAQSYYGDRNTGGGDIQDGLTHIANWIESVLGPTDSVLCDSEHLALPGVEVEDTVHIAARHREIMVSYAFNQFQAPQENTIQFNMPNGSLRIDFHKQCWGTFKTGGRVWKWHKGTIIERDAHFTTQAHSFLDQIEGKQRRLCSLSAAAQTLNFNLSALASSQSGRRVNCIKIQLDL